MSFVYISPRVILNIHLIWKQLCSITILRNRSVGQEMKKKCNKNYPNLKPMFQFLVSSRNIFRVALLKKIIEQFETVWILSILQLARLYCNILQILFHTVNEYTVLRHLNPGVKIAKFLRDQNITILPKGMPSNPFFPSIYYIMAQMARKRSHISSILYKMMDRFQIEFNIFFPFLAASL